MTTESGSYEDDLAALMALISTPDDEEVQDSQVAAAGAADRVDDAVLVDAGDVGQDLCYGSVDEFVREVIVPLYRRKVGPRGPRRWSAQWWRNGEAVSRLDGLWRSWEHLRQDGATGISSWWRDHADYHMNILFDPDGPFAASTDENRAGEPLPYDPPPPGLFTDARTIG
ncbi:protein of unknown function [Marinactinospora thermotolerans DSM 45154]|uniref:DUF4913 domain-containing protein n=1 Tax=Marinactinospora thermotolerans DSM 45154 TaxID=1122192 RepID=A0A1T4M487_9ACTN|nr:DUF4913 domain-containing protein [Marinactinospora thermotolerans]SJZ61598.1 protein of unknown function [Marinactinospora thermotolerans DSM 45154]